MRFGIVLSSDHQDGIPSTQALGDQLAKARVAQESGFHSVWTAANQDPGVVRAAQTVEGWLVSSRSTLATIERQIQLYQATLTEGNRSGYVAAWREMYVAEDKASAIATSGCKNSSCAASGRVCQVQRPSRLFGALGEMYCPSL